MSRKGSSASTSFNLAPVYRIKRKMSKMRLRDKRTSGRDVTSTHFRNDCSRRLSPPESRYCLSSGADTMRLCLTPGDIDDVPVNVYLDFISLLYFYTNPA